jgi:hypothetical protein
MGTVTAVEKKPEKKVIVRKRAGFRRIMVTVTEDQAKRLDELAIQDDRGSATNMLTVLVKRNFEAILKTAKPAQPVLEFGRTDEQQGS